MLPTPWFESGESERDAPIPYLYLLYDCEFFAGAVAIREDLSYPLVYVNKHKLLAGSCILYKQELLG